MFLKWNYISFESKTGGWGMKQSTGKKIVLFMFICSMVVVFKHSNGYIYYDLNGSPVINRIVKMMIDWFQYGLFSYAMPAFFMFSGLLFYRNLQFNTIPAKWKKRVKTLVLPYFLWNIIWMVIIIIMTGIPLVRNNVNVFELFEPSLNNIFKGIFLHKYNGAYWYMLSVMFLIAMAPLIFKFLENKYVGLGSLIVFFVLASAVHYKIDGLTLEYVFYYLSGAYLGLHYFDAVEATPSRKLSYISFTGFFIVTILVMNVKIYAFYIILNLAGIFFLWTFLSAVKMEPKWWMGNYFFIYSTHQVVLVSMDKILELLMPGNPVLVFVIGFIGCTVFVIVLLEYAAKWLKDKFPQAYGMLTGGR